MKDFKLIVLFLVLFAGVAVSQNIIKVEYFFNTDPGYGNAVNIPVSPGPDITNISFTADISGQANGFNHLYIRSKDANGKWSITNARSYFKETGYTSALNITEAEYFIDSDPGNGNGIAIPITPGPNVSNISFIADISGLANGFHYLYTRTKDEDGKWSMTNVKSFFKEVGYTSALNITEAEYFIDSDPGNGNGITIPITPGPNVSNISFIADISGLANGFHHLYTRTKDEDGKWSMTNVKSFFKEVGYASALNITEAEYFIDNDPGNGNGITIPITPGPNVSNISFIADISGLANGFHYLYTRTKDEDGKWSMTNTRSFYKEVVYTTLPDIVEAEYYIDTDPGFGNAIPLSITQGNNINVLFDIDIPSLSLGTHRICIRSKDQRGKWSMTNITELIIMDVSVLLEGPYSGGQMHTLLTPYLPHQQPYNPVLPYYGNMNPVWLYNGGEVIQVIPQNVVDWVLLELRETTGNASTATSDKRVWQNVNFLLSDGSVVALDGQRPVNILHTAQNNVYLVLHHRNHLSIMSSGPINTNTGLYNFTTGSSQVYGGTAGYKELAPGKWGMVAGDGNADGQINNTDKNEVWKPFAGQSGYLGGDFSMNGQVENNDKNLKWKPNSGAGSQVPDSMTPPGGYRSLVP